MKKPVYIGQMDRKITIKRKEKTQNALGEANDSLVEVCSPWAYRELGIGNELNEDATIPFEKRTYTIHYRPDVMREGVKLIVVDGAIELEVFSIKEGERKRKIILECKRYG